MTEPYLKFAAAPGRVRALFQGHEIADSANAVVLNEGSYGPVVYFPREDVEMLALRRTDRSTRCPHKGAASYFTIYRDANVIDNAAWSYEDPIDGASLIKDHIAFYPQHVEIEMDARAAGETDLKVPPHDPPYADIDPLSRD